MDRDYVTLAASAPMAAGIEDEYLSSKMLYLSQESDQAFRSAVGATNRGSQVAQTTKSQSDTQHVSHHDDLMLNLIASSPPMSRPSNRSFMVTVNTENPGGTQFPTKIPLPPPKVDSKERSFPHGGRGSAFEVPSSLELTLPSCASKSTVGPPQSQSLRRIRGSRALRDEGKRSSSNINVVQGNTTCEDIS